MGTTVEYWDDPRPDIRLNPQLPDPPAGIQAAAEKFAPGSVVFQTSGTVGPSKFAAVSKQPLLANAAAVNRHLRVTPADHWLLALPTFHVGGFSILARSHVGGTGITESDAPWSAAGFCEALAGSGATLSALVPTQIHDLIQTRSRPPDCLRAVLVGGAALPDSLANPARELGWPILPTYGMTEASSQIATAPLAESGMPESDSAPALRILDGWETRVDDDRQLWIRGPGLFAGYLCHREGQWQWIEPFDASGWFATGDRAEINDNQLVPAGRIAEEIKVLGERVDLRALRARLEDRMPTVHHHQWHCLALPHDRLGSEIVLVVENDMPEDLAEKLVTDWNRNVAPFERIQRQLAVGTFPRSPLGKVIREELVAALGKSL